MSVYERWLQPSVISDTAEYQKLEVVEEGPLVKVTLFTGGSVSQIWTKTRQELANLVRWGGWKLVKEA